jgi:hypothetical protein
MPGMHVGRDRERDARVRQTQQQHDSLRERLAEEQRGHQQYQRRIDVDHDAFERRGDVVQPQEVQIARQVVPEHAERRQFQPVRAREPARLAPLQRPGHHEQQRQGVAHAQAQQRLRIGAVAIGRLDEDGLERESECAHGGEHEAGGAVGGRLFGRVRAQSHGG